MAKGTNRISKVVVAKDITDGIELIKQGYAKISPYLIDGVTEEELKHEAKLGEAGEPYVEKGIEFAKSNSDLVPRRCNVAEAEKDYIVYESLRPVATILNQYAEQVALTRKVAGIEVLECVNDFYKSVKEDAEDGVAAAIPVANELGKRYVGRKKKTSTSNS